MDGIDHRDVEAAREGDLAAYSRVIAATQDMVQAVSFGVLRRREDAQDAAQETYLRAFRRLRDLKDPHAVAGWLRALAIHVALNQRRRRRGAFVVLDEACDVPVLDDSEERWSAAQRQSLALALLALPDDDRRLCDRRYHGGWSVARLAADARVGEGAMAKRLQRLRDRLREAVETRERNQMDTEATKDMPERVVELLARPRLVDLPENPVGRIVEALSSAFAGHETIELPEIVDLARAREWLGTSPVYIGPEKLQPVEGDRVLRYDLSLPMLQGTRLDAVPVRRLAAGKVYRRETVSASHLEAFHQLEVLVADEAARLDAWAFVGMVLRAVDAALPGAVTRMGPTEYPFCARAWQLDVEDAGAWVEIMALGEYAPFVVRAMGGNPDRLAVFGAGFGLERIACLRFGIDDIRKVEEARVGG